MSKRNKKSRLTKTDVNTICEMQRKIDAYEDFIVAICGLMKHREPRKFACLIKGTDMDDWMQMAWRDCVKLIEECKEKQQ